ncbi:hypothetical protein LLH23_15360 [bacterium]|nr:hypothetical protein [bacterium]
MARDRVTMTMPEGLWPALKRVAAARQKSASQFAAEAIMEALEAEQKRMRLEAVARIKEMRCPAGTPEQIEQEIERGRFMDEPI